MPQIRVSVKSNAKQTRVEKITEASYRIFVKQPPDQGRANAAVLEALHYYFKIPKACIRLVRGHTSKQKNVEIDADIMV